MEALGYYALFILVAIYLGNNQKNSGPDMKIEETPSDILDDIYK